MALLSATPLLVIALLAYNAVVFFGGDAATLSNGLFSTHLISGAEWTVTVADLLLAFGLLLLYVEVSKATRTTASAVINHTLSTLVFVAFLVEFLTVGKAGTSTFFILMLMSLVDVVAGFTVSIVSARRDIGLDERVNL